MSKITETKEEILVKNAGNVEDTMAVIIHKNNISYIPKVSVIIPVYNVEKYLKQCLDSIVNQTLQEIEIICVDDGSTDNSLKILKEYAEKDNRITLIVQKNLHAGVARNAGLAVAKGEYISFLDSDDFFELNMFATMYDTITAESSDICFCQYKNYNNETGTLGESRGINKNFGNNENQTIKTFDYKDELFTMCNPMPWNKLIKRDFIKKNNISFQALLSSNDIFFSMLAMACSSQITLIFKPFVFYRYNRKESLKNNRDKSPFSFYYAYMHLYNTLQKKKLLEKFKVSFFRAFISTCFWTLNNTQKERLLVKNFIKDQIIPEFSLFVKNKRYIPNNFYIALKELYTPDLIISLTSYPARIKTVRLTINSLLNQTKQADRIILWLAPEQFPNKEYDLPQELLELKNQGLSIDWYQDIKSYKKLIPTLKKYPDCIIVTADDDNIYPKQWLEKLYNSYKKNPKDIHCHRVTKFYYDHGFEYISGGHDYYNKPCYLNKLVGLGGVLYPLNCFYKDILNEELFMKLAPTNDDQWFWFQAILNGTKVRVVNNPDIDANYIPQTQEFGLTNINDKGEHLFWNDFNRILEYYPKLNKILIKDAKKLKFKGNSNIDKQKLELKNWYKKVTKQDLDFINPKTYNEKIQWLKLYNSTQTKTLLADKYLVRDWVKDKIGEDYLIPLLGVWDNFDEIDFDKLPNKFVLKCNHGCGYNIIVHNKSQLNIQEARRKINCWMSEDFAFKYGFEMHYSQIPRKIIAEKYIENDNNDLHDYKFWCFSGKVKYIQYLSERYTNGLKMAFYDRNWNKQNFVYSYPKDLKVIAKPENLDLMISLAEKLAQDFNHVRVDFYKLNNNKIYFGEMTFTSASGTCKWIPKNIDLRLGQMIKLPKIAYNIYNKQYYKLPNRNFKKNFSQILSLRNSSNKSHKIITLFGVQIKIKRDKIKRIFSACNRPSKNKWYKVIYFLGIKFSFRNKKKEQNVKLDNFNHTINDLKRTVTNLEQQNSNLKISLEQIKKDKEEIINYLEQKINKLTKNLDNEKRNLSYKMNKYCPDEKRPLALSDWFYERTGKLLNLDNPKTYNEKIQWLKLYDSTPTKTILADKYLVRGWVKDKIGEDYLIPLFGVWDNFDDIEFDKLPDKFVLKCNHGSGYNIIVQDKSKLNIQEARRTINRWMSEDFAFKAGFEMHYSQIPRKIIAEEYIDPGISNIEIQIYCYEGEIKYLSYETCKDNNVHCRQIFDENWKPLDFKISPSHYDTFNKLPSCPNCLTELKEISKDLSNGFKHVRVDFILVEDKIKFREMTFTSGSGLSVFEPESVALELGNYINID